MHVFGLPLAPATIAVSVLHCAIMTLLFVNAMEQLDASAVVSALFAVAFTLTFTVLSWHHETRGMIKWWQVLAVYAAGFAIQSLVAIVLIGVGPITFWGANLAPVFAVFGIAGWESRNRHKKQQN